MRDDFGHQQREATASYKCAKYHEDDEAGRVLGNMKVVYREAEKDPKGYIYISCLYRRENPDINLNINRDGAREHMMAETSFEDNDYIYLLKKILFLNIICVSINNWSLFVLSESVYPF